MKKTSQEYEYLQGLFQDCGYVELRAIRQGDTPKWAWFEHPDPLIDRARAWAGEGVILCTTMALPDYAPAAVEPHERGYFPPWALSDAKAKVTRRLLFDFDRKNKVRRNATAEEIEEATALRSQFVRYMAAQGWPAPALGTSGNGVHALYRVRMTYCDEVTAAVKRMYRGMSDTFQSERIKLDTTTHNAAQACRLYGAVNRKYFSEPGRPQRQATIALPPDWMRTDFTPRDWIVSEYPSPPKPDLKLVSNRPRSGADWCTLDIVSWFQAHDLYVKPLAGDKHAVVCPWQARGEHEKTSYSDTVIWETARNGYPTFHCSHDTCAGRGSLCDLNEVLGDISDFCESPRAAS